MGLLAIYQRSSAVAHRVLPHVGVRQLVKYALVGVLGLGFDWGVFYALHPLVDPLGQLGLQLGKAVAFLVASAGTYWVNRVWTFRSSHPEVAAEGARFLVVSCVGLALNNAAFYLASAPTALALPLLVSLVIATSASGSWNFLAHKFWTFRDA